MNWISLRKEVEQKIGIDGLGVLKVIWNIVESTTRQNICRQSINMPAYIYLI